MSKAHPPNPASADFDADFLIVGSGFGGAVSALRLRQKGYGVLLLERGGRIGPQQIRNSRKRISKFFWLPELGWRGFFWQRTFKHVALIGGTGLGGGSLVFGGVLLQPKRTFFEDPQWSHLGVDWEAELSPHYETAKRMLGRQMTPVHSEMDSLLQKAAEEVGAGDTFGPTPLAIYFGQQGVVKPDPFFNGDGPARTGCNLCGECMSGCLYGSKNSLDYNYLYLAEKLGAQIRTDSDVASVKERASGGYEVATKPAPGRAARTYRAKNVVLAAGVLGTLELLFGSREAGQLPNVSGQLGNVVRTNSEAITGILSPGTETDLSEGPAISSHFYPNERTHITQNRISSSQWFMRFTLAPLVDGTRPRIRRLKAIGKIMLNPSRGGKIWLGKNFNRRLSVLTVMQYSDSQLRFEFKAAPWSRGRSVLRSAAVPGREAPSFLPVANQVTRAFAQASKGIALNQVIESIGNKSVTAHILGGAVMGSDSTDGVIDTNHQVFGHPGLYVADASAISANLGVNPSLTITAMAERFASQFPDAAEQAEVPAQQQQTVAT